MQFVFGVVIGGVLGVIIAPRLFRFGLSGFDQMLFVAPGVALCFGAYASYYGRRAWMMSWTFALEEPLPNPNARSYSVFVGSIGAALVLIPVFLHIFVGHSSRHVPVSIGLGVFLLLLAAVPGFLVFQALRTGTGYSRLGFIDRDEAPVLFWGYVILNSVLVVGLLFQFVR